MTENPLRIRASCSWRAMYGRPCEQREGRGVSGIVNDVVMYKSGHLVVAPARRRRAGQVLSVQHRRTGNPPYNNAARVRFTAPEKGTGGF